MKAEIESVEAGGKPAAARGGTCAFVTLGCKINQYETEAVREEILDLGYREVPADQAADVYVINTCSVTRMAGVKSRRFIQRVARINPQSRVIVMGCSSPSEREAFRRIPQVAVLAGNEEKGMIPAFLAAGLRPGELVPEGPLPPLRPPRKRRGGGGPGSGRDILDLRVSRFEGRTRGYVKVQDGCSVFCSFCIIPYLRGLSRSREPRAVIEEVRRLAANGYRELVIAGVHIQDYGRDLPGGWTLERLLRELGDAAAGAGIWRLRLSSIGPRAFTPGMVDLLRDPIFCPHWHIPAQSGDDRVLERMRRGYTRADFLRVVEALRAAFPHPSITTDVIAGHPGEDEEAFQNTVDLCLEAGFSKIHVFPYSRREGTRAAAMEDAVPAPAIQARVRHLLAVERELALAYKRRFLGAAVEVLVEGAAADDPEGSLLEGLTERFIRVRFPRADLGARGGVIRRHRASGNVLHRLRVEAVQPGWVAGRWEAP